MVRRRTPRAKDSEPKWLKTSRRISGGSRDSDMALACQCKVSKLGVEDIVRWAGNTLENRGSTDVVAGWLLDAVNFCRMSALTRPARLQTSQGRSSGLSIHVTDCILYRYKHSSIITEYILLAPNQPACSQGFRIPQDQLQQDIMNKRPPRLSFPWQSSNNHTPRSANACSTTSCLSSSDMAFPYLVVPRVKTPPYSLRKRPSYFPRRRKQQSIPPSMKIIPQVSRWKPKRQMFEIEIRQTEEKKTKQ